MDNKRNKNIYAIILGTTICMSLLSACSEESSDVGSADNSSNTSKLENTVVQSTDQPATEKDFIALLKKHSDDFNGNYNELYNYISDIQSKGNKVSQDDLATLAANVQSGLDTALNVQILCLSSPDFEISERVLTYSIEGIEGYQEFLNALTGSQNNLNIGLKKVTYSKEGLTRCVSDTEDLTKSAILFSNSSNDTTSEKAAENATTNTKTQTIDIEKNNSAPSVFDFTASDVKLGEQDISNLKTKFGELLSVIYNDGIVVVKTKITSNLTSNMTIEQNYFIVEDLVKEHGFNTCKELQYWAVADMADGDERKCISFTLDKHTIDSLYNGNIVANQLGENVQDLWILPSLQG